MTLRSVLQVLPFLAVSACTTTPAPSTSGQIEQIEQTVAATERAFAASMAERDFEAFKSHLAEDAVFIGADRALRGKPEIAAAWQRYFVGSDAPFSWQPALVTALQSADLALSTGPVYDPAGHCAGTFTSIWRRNADGSWHIIFDRGGADCGERPPP